VFLFPMSRRREGRKGGEENNDDLCFPCLSKRLNNGKTDDTRQDWVRVFITHPCLPLLILYFPWVVPDNHFADFSHILHITRRIGDDV
jgi:hypothetical protein